MTELENVKQQLASTAARCRELEILLEDLTDFIENASIPLHWVNGSGVIIWVNQAELDLLGYEKSEYVGRHISNFHADPHVIEDILSRLINKETIRNYPARLKCKNGGIKTVLINSNVYWKDGKFLHTRCFSRDVSELKAAEEQKNILINSLLESNETLKKEIENHTKSTIGKGL